MLPLLCSNQGINEPVSSNGKGKGIGPFETPAGWQQVENPVKVLQGSGDSAVIDPNDVRQNWLGDCYFAAALAEIALRNPTVIYRDIDENGDYTFDVTLPSIYVVKNLHPMYPIPTNPAKPQYIQNGDQGGPYIESWPLILENTWALYKGNNDIVQGYTNIGSGGSSGEVMQALTGVPSYWIPGNKLTYSDIKNHFDQGDLIILGSLQTANGLPEYAGDRPYANRLFTDHAYPVSAVDGGNVEVHNVWDWDHMSTKVDGNRLSVLFDGAYVNPGH